MTNSCKLSAFIRFDVAICVHELTLLKEDIVRLHGALRMPHRWKTKSRSVFSGVDALLILLARFAYPDRWRSQERLFGRTEQELSACFNSVVAWLHGRHWMRVRGVNCLWTEERIQDYVRAVARITGHQREFVFGWLDGFFIDCARPGGSYWMQVTRPHMLSSYTFQRIIYNGHEHSHGWKTQCLGLPNGLYGLVTDLERGATHDMQGARLAGKHMTFLGSIFFLVF